MSIPRTMNPATMTHSLNRNTAISLSTLLLALLVSGTGFVACNSAEDQLRRSMRDRAFQQLDDAREIAERRWESDMARKAYLDSIESSFPEIEYRRIHLSSRSVLDSIRDAFDYGELSSPAYRAFTTLNRRAFSSLGVGDTVVVPTTVIDDLRAYTVFPHVYFEAQDIPKLVVVSNAFQAYAAYENGVLVRFAACNTGSKSKPTLPGRYAMNWRERLRISSLNDNWKLPYNINFHLYAGNAFHVYHMPGRPVSHSCVRQFEPDAEWLFEWGEMGEHNSSGRVRAMTGTPVLIVDMFDYERPKYGPWIDLATNRSVRLELPEDPMGVEEAYIPISQIPPSVRGGLPNRSRYVHAADTLQARGWITEGWYFDPSREYTREREERARRRAAAAASARRVSGDREDAESEPRTLQPVRMQPSAPAPQSDQSPTRAVKPITVQSPDQSSDDGN